jgi:signal recognition particle GTPase
VLLTELKNQLNEVKRRLEDKILADDVSYQAKEVVKIIDQLLLEDEEQNVPTEEHLSKLSKCLNQLSTQTQEKLDLLDFVPLISKF